MTAGLYFGIEEEHHHIWGSTSQLSILHSHAGGHLAKDVKLDNIIMQSFVKTSIFSSLAFARL